MRHMMVNGFVLALSLFAGGQAYAQNLSTEGAGTIAQRASEPTGDYEMNNDKLRTLIDRLATGVEGHAGFWRFKYGGRELYVMTDEPHNRMRTMTPIVKADGLDAAALRTLLEANFDKALDARFALYQGALWSVFIHPLGELTGKQFEECLRQVKTLADNYGTTYSSSDLVFVGGQKQ